MYPRGQREKGWPMTGAVQTRYRVAGMDCGSCAAKVDAAVRRLPGVEDVSVSATVGTMTVHHQPDPALFPAMKSQLKSIGYGLAPAESESPGARAHDHEAGLHLHLHEHGAEEEPWWR